MKKFKHSLNKDKTTKDAKWCVCAKDRSWKNKERRQIVYVCNVVLTFVTWDFDIC